MNEIHIYSSIFLFVYAHILSCSFCCLGNSRTVLSFVKARNYCKKVGKVTSVNQKNYMCSTIKGDKKMIVFPTELSIYYKDFMIIEIKFIENYLLLDTVLILVMFPQVSHFVFSCMLYLKDYFYIFVIF